ncbi:MAG: SWIM zinc finger family protein, partial [Bacteroidota bacterium]
MKRSSTYHPKIQQAIESSPEKIQARAKKLFRENHVFFLEQSPDLTTDFYLVRSQYGDDDYEVSITFDNDLECYCTCPYDYSLYCKHTLAVFHYILQESDLQNNQAKTPRGMEIKLKTFIDLLKENDYDHIKKRNKSLNTTIEDFSDGLVSLNVENAGQQHHVSFKSQKEQSRIALHCDCSYRSAFHLSFCEHQIAALKHLKEQYGDFFLHESFDWTPEKKKLLAQAEFTIDDPYEEYISFDYDDKSIGLIASRKNNLLINKDIQSISNSLAPKTLLPDHNEKNPEEYGFALQKTTDERLIEIKLIRGAKMKNKIQFRKISASLEETHPSHFFNMPGYEPYQKLHQWYSINMHPEVFKNEFPQAIKDSYYFLSAKDENESARLYYNTLLNNLEETKRIAYQYIPKINEFVKRTDGLQFFKAPPLHYYEPLRAKHLTPITISQEPIKCQLNISVKDISYEITGKFYHAGEEIVLDPMFMHLPWLTGIGNNETAPWENPGTFLCALLQHFKNPGTIFINKRNTNDLMSFIESFQNEIEINMSELKPNQVKKQKPNFKITLSEMSDFLLFYPIAQYGEKEVVVNPKSQHNFSYDQENEQFNQTNRDQEAEENFLNFFLDLHPRFSSFNQQDFFHLHANEVMKDFWFMDFFEKCLERNIELFGFENIKSIKYNPNKPTTNYNIKSGTDWFDIEMDVWFGKEKVSLSEIRKSVLRKENTVKLSDGSTGILPGEWIKEWYETLRFGEIKKNNIKVSNMHFLFVDQLFNKLDNQEKIKELKEKRKKLNNFKKIKQIEAPAGLNATLRDYQKTGLS